MGPAALTMNPYYIRLGEPFTEEWIRDQALETIAFIIDECKRFGWVLEFDPVRRTYNIVIDPDSPATNKRERNEMLEKIIKLYHTYMIHDVRSPIPHLAGPPGVGKSTVVQILADMLGKKLHIINVARINVLEIEGVQMPVGHAENVDEYRLKLLTSTIWTQLREGDIVLLDEFMRGFPEVYNGLLDIMTSREVAGFPLPKVFFIAASNSVAAYDKALEDRLLHIPVPDIRKDKKAKKHMKELFIEELGLNPKIISSSELEAMITTEVTPMYDILDQFDGTGSRGNTTIKGQSIRKLIGQALLREMQSITLREVISFNNTISMSDDKPQFVLLPSGKNPPPTYEGKARKLIGNEKLTKIQSENLKVNLQLIEMEEASTETIETEGDDDAEYII